MTEKIRLISKTTPVRFKIGTWEVVVNKGLTEVTAEQWAELRKHPMIKRCIDAHALSIENESEAEEAMEQWRSECFSKFESDGLPSVKTSISSGEFSGAVLDLAKEWVESKKLSSTNESKALLSDNSDSLRENSSKLRSSNFLMILSLSISAINIAISIINWLIMAR